MHKLPSPCIRHQPRTYALAYESSGLKPPLNMSDSSCRHPDVREFDGVRCCLSCGNAIIDKQPTNPIQDSISTDGSGVQRAYHYRNLNHELGQEIRLVTIQPDTDSYAPIRCRITHVDLERSWYASEYIAISYTWATEDGDAQKSKLVHITDGTVLAVTVSCEAALRQLRKPGLECHVWVDAVCINQLNTVERNHQVGLMDLIYSKAMRVHICIQDPHHDYEIHFKWLADRSATANPESYLAPGLRRLLMLSWFHRVWVIQEVALAKAALLNVNNNRLFLSLDVLQKLREFCDQEKIQVPASLRWDPGAGEKINILDCLSAARTCRATDARDRVYATLSLVDDDFRRLITIDYGKNSKWIHEMVAINTIQYHRNLDILYHIHSDEHANSPSSSSWIPDWNQTLSKKTRIMQFPNDSILSWSRNVQVNLESHDTIESIEESSQKLLSTIAPGHIVYILRFEETSISYKPRLFASASFIDEIGALPVGPCARYTKVLNNSSLLVNDEYRWVLPYFRASDQKYRNQSSGWTCARTCPLKEIQNEEVPDFNVPDLIQFLTDMYEWGEDMLAFETHYSVGFTNVLVEIGDSVFVIDGVRSPFILRKLSDGRYSIRGECYLWAALDLDCWNMEWSNRRKGRWRQTSEGRPWKNYVFKDGIGRSRIIEIANGDLEAS